MTNLARLLILLIMTGLLIAGCGDESSEQGGSDTAASDTDSSDSESDRRDNSESESEETASATGTPAETTTQQRVVCHVPEPTPIPLGEAFDGEVLGWDECFTVEVPAGVATFTVELAGLEDQLNLSVGYSDPETILYNTGAFWASREDDLADESVVIESPEPGIYYINVAVATYRNESPFTLTTSTS
jgi:ABC-type Fe3+-hydroxamate transport system substrate-binding protein